jgi:NADH:ubiquinone reductase (H+-translocating)
MLMSDASNKTKQRVLILGGGFAGTGTAISLGKLARYDDNIEVDLVSDENYFVFQPMLPEVAAGGLEASHIVNPIRRLCPYVNFHRAGVEEVDLEKKTVTILGDDLTAPKVLQFDHLVISLGLIVDLKRNPGMSEHSLAMKTLGDAFFLRNEVIDRLERADIEADPVIRKRLMTFVVVGGGFSGVETIAEINDMIKDALRYYKNYIKPEELRVVLIHSRERILQELDEKLGVFAQEKLAQRGVEMCLNARVQDASKDSVRYKSKITGEVTTIPTSLLICTIGNAPHPVIGQLPIANKAGRMDTNECLQVVTNKDTDDEKVLDGLWALGDAAFVRDITKIDEKTGKYKTCPPTAQYAGRQGTVCGKNIYAMIHGDAIRPFKFAGLGQMAVIGHLTGVAQVMGFNFSGFPAFFLWRLVYWMKLPGLLPKLRVALDWCIDLFFPTDITQMRVFRTEKVARSHYHAGAFIFHEGDIGDSFYVIEQGEVEITKDQPDGKEPLVLATLKEGDSFGEIALLKKVSRTAGARCKTPVNCLTMSRTDFQALSSTFKKFREDLTAHVEKIGEQNRNKLNAQMTKKMSTGKLKSLLDGKEIKDDESESEAGKPDSPAAEKAESQAKPESAATPESKDKGEKADEAKEDDGKSVKSS